MPTRRSPVLRTLVAGVSVVLVAGAIVAAASAFGAASYTDCDNLAGECLRARQQWALRAIGLAAAGLSLGCLWAAGRTLVVGVARSSLLALVLTLAFLAAFESSQPDAHLDNRWRGWLHDPLD